MKDSLYKKLLSICFLGVLLFASCKKEVAQSIVPEEQGIVAVNSDTTIDFSNYKTVAINDSVVFTNGRAYSRELNDVDEAYIEEWQDSLSSVGYTIVDKSQNPDLILNITKVDNTSRNIFDYSTYWNYYPVMYRPVLFGNANAKYKAIFDNSQTTRDLILSFELIDLTKVSQNILPVVWNGVITDKTISTDIGDVSDVIATLLYESPELRNQ
jgi:hypothetical protein